MDKARWSCSVLYKSLAASSTCMLSMRSIDLASMVGVTIDFLTLYQVAVEAMNDGQA